MIWELSPSGKCSPCRKREEAARNFGKLGAAEGAILSRLIRCATSARRRGNRSTPRNCQAVKGSFPRTGSTADPMLLRNSICLNGERKLI
jgi:hypothetical protein